MSAEQDHKPLFGCVGSLEGLGNHFCRDSSGIVSGLRYRGDQAGWIVRPLLYGDKIAKEQADGLESTFTGSGLPAGVSKPLGNLLFGDGQGRLGWVGAREVLDPMCAGRNG